MLQRCIAWSYHFHLDATKWHHQHQWFSTFLHTQMSLEAASFMIFIWLAAELLRFQSQTSTTYSTYLGIFWHTYLRFAVASDESLPSHSGSQIMHRDWIGPRCATTWKHQSIRMEHILTHFSPFSRILFASKWPNAHKTLHSDRSNCSPPEPKFLKQQPLATIDLCSCQSPRPYLWHCRFGQLCQAMCSYVQVGRKER